jgi:hypothetical protein
MGTCGLDRIADRLLPGIYHFDFVIIGIHASTYLNQLNPASPKSAAHKWILPINKTLNSDNIDDLI